MIANKFSTIIAAAFLGAGLFAATPQIANAGGVSLELLLEKSHGTIYVGKYKNHGKHAHKRRKKCRPGKAIRQAQNFGIRHAEIERIGRKFIVVSGRKRGKWVKAGMERRSRHCSVAWIKRERHARHYGGRHSHDRGRVYRYRY